MIRKRRRLSGRSMQSNWQLGSNKSNTANDVIGVLKKSGGMLAQIKAMKEAEDMSESEAQRLKHKQEVERIEADRRLKQQSKLAHDLAQELTKPKASHTAVDTATSESGYSSTAVARQLAKPSLSRQLSRTNLFSEDKTAASLAAKKASLKAPRRTLQDKDQSVTTTSNKKSSVATAGAGPKANSLKRKGSSKQHKTAAGKSRTSESSDELNKDHAPRTVTTGRTSVTGISDDEDFADDEVIPEPPRRVNSADGGKPRRPAAVFNAADVMKNLKLTDDAGGKAKDSVDSEDIVFD